MGLARKVLLLAMFLMLSACGRSVASRGAESASAPAPAPGMPAPEEPAMYASVAEDSEASGAPSAAPSAPEAPPAVQAAPAPPPPPPTATAGVMQPSSAAPNQPRMLDIEARLTLKVEDVPR